MGVRYRQVFQAHPPAYLNPADPNFAGELDALVLTTRANYLSLTQGELGVIAIGADVLENDEAEEDFDLAQATNKVEYQIYCPLILRNAQ